MTRQILLATAAASLLFASASPAAAPQFDTPAKVAYLVDLNSGAVLYSKNADAHMPPASLAKMMTTEVAFELIDKGQLPLNKMCTVRPETWQKWHGPQAGSTMFLSPNEQVSVENLLKGIVTLSGNDAAVVLSECIAGTEQAFTDQMNALAKKLGATNSHFGTANGWPDNGVTYVTARDLATIARRGTSRRWPKRRSSTIPSSTRTSTASRASPGAKPWAAMRSRRTIATRSSATFQAPMVSRPGTPRKPATASQARQSRTGGG